MVYQERCVNLVELNVMKGSLMSLPRDKVKYKNWSIYMGHSWGVIVFYLHELSAGVKCK